MPLTTLKIWLLFLCHFTFWPKSRRFYRYRSVTGQKVRNRKTQQVFYFVGVPNHARLNLAVRLRAFLLRFS